MWLHITILHITSTKNGIGNCRNLSHGNLKINICSYIQNIIIKSEKVNKKIINYFILLL